MSNPLDDALSRAQRQRDAREQDNNWHKRYGVEAGLPYKTLLQDIPVEHHVIVDGFLSKVRRSKFESGVIVKHPDGTDRLLTKMWASGVQKLIATAVRRKTGTQVRFVSFRWQFDGHGVMHLVDDGRHYAGDFSLSVEALARILAWTLVHRENGWIDR